MDVDDDDPEARGKAIGDIVLMLLGKVGCQGETGVVFLQKHTSVICIWLRRLEPRIRRRGEAGYDSIVFQVGHLFRLSNL